MIIPFPEFAPDKSPFNPGATDVALNCLPVADGWGPLADLLEQSEALPSTVLGGVYARKSDGSTIVFAGTATNLYRLNTSTSPYSWDEVSITTDGYAVPVGEKWMFEKFGELLIATQAGNYPQSINIESGTTFGNLTTEFKAKYIAGVSDFLVFAFVDDDPNTVRWSGLNDATFYTAGDRGSDIQVIPSGGEIMGIVGDDRGALILQRDAIELMQVQYASQYTFSFATANSKRGVIAPYSITQIGQNQFAYLSEDGFFAGVEGRPIGAERVDDWFLSEIDRDYLFDVRGMADPLRKIIWWRYRNTSAENRLIGYDWQLDRWCYSDLDLTEAASIATPDISWDGLDALYATIDDADVPFDSPLFEGGKPVFGGFTSDNKLAYLAGGSKAAKLATAWIEPSSGRRAFARTGRLIGDCDDYTVTPCGLNDHGAMPTKKSAISPSPRSKRIAMRQDARLHRFEVNIAAGDVWTNTSSFDAVFTGSGQL